MWYALGAVVAALAALAVWDRVQRKHTILRNFPLIGHFRYLLEAVGPELRQYIVTDNDEERPFSRDQRRWVYASAKRANNYFGFGTDNDLEHLSNYLIVKHAAFPLREPAPGDPEYDLEHRLPCAKVLGGALGRAKAFRPESALFVSGMSFGALSGNATEAIDKGCAEARALHNTGEGGISVHHRHGAPLVWQIGTGYFGARGKDGGFDRRRFLETLEESPTVRAIEVKLSQGAKPGRGGVLPAAKITREIADARDIPVGRDCQSPVGHSAFHDVDSMLDFIEELSDLSGGLPVGIKSAVGEDRFWRELADRMAEGGRGVDFVAVDGGEGGTGAAPLVFSDHVSLPFKVGFPRVYKIFHEAGLAERVVFGGSGRLGFPEQALLAFALGCDLVGVAREAMLAVGCIQAQRCHTDHCPSGVATQNRWLAGGLVPDDKAPRMANYLHAMRRELLQLSRACGAEHPAFVGLEHLEVLDDRFGARSLEETFGYHAGYGIPSAERAAELREHLASLHGAPA